MQAQNWVTLVVGLLAASGVIGTLWQRQRSEATDRRLRLEYEARAEWWRRFEWAADKSVSGDIDARALGLRLVEALVSSPLVTGSEGGILDALASLSDNEHVEFEGSGDVS